MKTLQTSLTAALEAKENTDLMLKAKLDKGTYFLILILHLHTCVLLRFLIRLF